MQLNQQVDNKHNEGIVIRSVSIQKNDECIVIRPTNTQ